MEISRVRAAVKDQSFILWSIYDEGLIVVKYRPLYIHPLAGGELLFRGEVTGRKTVVLKTSGVSIPVQMFQAWLPTVSWGATPSHMRRRFLAVCLAFL